MTEISYLESEYINLLNTLNNIKFENYDRKFSNIENTQKHILRVLNKHTKILKQLMNFQQNN